MATTGTFAFTLDIAEMIEEAWERCGKDPTALMSRHITSAIRSLNLLLREWENRNVVQWQLVEETQTMVASTGSFALPTGSIDIISAVLQRDGVDIPMVMISRQEWLDIPDKLTEGRPNRYWVERVLGVPTVHLWSVPENSTDIMVYYRLRPFEDAGAMVNTVDVQQRWLDALVAGLTWKLSEKYAQDQENRKLSLYNLAYKFADDEERERGPTVMRVDLGRRGRRW